MTPWLIAALQGIGVAAIGLAAARLACGKARKDQVDAEAGIDAVSLAASFVLGLYAATLLGAIAMYAGVDLTLASWTVNTLGWIICITYVFLKVKQKRFAKLPFASARWWEWLALLLIGAKVAFIVLYIATTMTMFDDPLQHWSGRARALFGGVNWSWDPQSPVFLGMMDATHYPLGVPIYRAMHASLAGAWNEVGSRIDGLWFFVSTAVAVWAGLRITTGNRFIAAAGAFTVSSVPFQAWHGAIGAADIAVQAYAAGAMACLVSRRWLLAGLLVAGACWMKNDALFIVLPAMSFAALTLWCTDPETWRVKGLGRWRPLGLFALGCASVGPWLLFKHAHQLSATPFKMKLQYHAEAWGMLYEHVLNGGTHSFFWWAGLGALLASAPLMLRKPEGRALLAGACGMLAAALCIFVGSNAFVFLQSEETVHRTALQLYGVIALAAFYGVWLLRERSRKAAATASAARAGALARSGSNPPASSSMAAASTFAASEGASLSSSRHAASAA